MMCMHNIRSLPLTGVGPVNIPPSMDLRPAFPPSRAVGGEWSHAPRSLARAHALHSGRSEEGIADTETREPARRGARTPPACLPRVDTPPHVGPTPTTITMTTYHHTSTSTKHPTKPERIIPHCFIAPTPSNALCLGCLYLNRDVIPGGDYRRSTYTPKAAGPAWVGETTGGAQGSCACTPRETLLVAGFSPFCGSY